MPLLNAVVPSNQEQIAAAVDMVVRTGRKAVGVIGLGGAEAGDGPLAAVIEQLIERGCDLRIHDADADREALRRTMPHLVRLMVDDVGAVLAHAVVVVLGSDATGAAAIAPRLHPAQHVVDFVRIGAVEQAHANYAGLCW